MTAGARPAAETAIDVPMVRALLRAQHADLADLPLERAGGGWDNVLFRLGADLAVRMPRRGLAVPLIEKEQRWLPALAPQLPLPVPTVLRVGKPGCNYPWPWSVTPWLPGRAALHAPLSDPMSAAAPLGSFLQALHQPAPSDAPANPFRGIPLAARDLATRAHLARLGSRIDYSAATDLWQRLVKAPTWAGPPLWIHGDLHPGNVLVDEGRISAILDFGDLAAGDPATDLAAMWMLLPRPAWPALVAGACGGPHSSDSMADTLTRARGWALALGAACAASSRDDEAMGAMGLATIAAALED